MIETADASRSRGRIKDEVVKELGPRLQIVKRSYLWAGDVVREEFIVQRDQSGPGKKPWGRIQMEHCSNLRAAERAAGTAEGTSGSDPRPDWFLAPNAETTPARPDWYLPATTDWRL